MENMIDMDSDQDPTLHPLNDMMIIGGKDTTNESYYILGRSEEIVTKWVDAFVMFDKRLTPTGVPTQRGDGLWSCCVMGGYR